MRPFRTVCLAASLLAVATVAHAQGQARLHYLHLVNRAHDSVVSLAVAEAGSATFRGVPVDPLRGGGDAATVGIAGAGCDYDLRFAFQDGRTLVYRDVDICRYGPLRIQPLPRKDLNASKHFTASLAR